MIPEPLVTDCEAAALCLNLRRVGERGAPQLSQVVVIRVDHAVSRHGYEFAAEWMQAEPVKLVGQGRFIGELSGTVIAQNGGLNVTESLRITQVIQHENTGCDGMKASEGGVRPQRGRQLFDRFESPAGPLNFEDLLGRR